MGVSTPGMPSQYSENRQMVLTDLALVKEKLKNELERETFRRFRGKVVRDDNGVPIRDLRPSFRATDALLRVLRIEAEVWGLYEAPRRMRSLDVVEAEVQRLLIRYGTDSDERQL